MAGKGSEKGPPTGRCTVASYAMAMSGRQRLKKWRYITGKAHSQPVGQPSGRLGTAIVSALGGCKKRRVGKVQSGRGGILPRRGG